MSTRFFHNGKELQENDNLSSMSEGAKIIVMTDDSVKRWGESYTTSIKELLKYAMMILNKTSTSSLSDLQKNIAQSGFFVHHCPKGSSHKKYTISEAKKILESYNHNINSSSIAQMQELGDFLNSFSHYRANTFTFGMDTDSLKFLLLPSEYSNSIGYYNKLNSGAKGKFIKALTEVFHSMGVRYVPVVITDGFRTMDEQAERVNKRGCQYYMDKVGSGSDSYPYLETLKKIYDDKLDMETVLSSAKIVDGAKEKIRKHKGELLATLKALINEYFNPSKHTIGYSLDIRDRSNHADTAHNIHKKTGGYISSDHTHLNLD